MTEAEQIYIDQVAQVESLRSSEGYINAGSPDYEHLFGRDACVSAIQLLGYDTNIAQGTLNVLARHQGKKRSLAKEEYPGRILHEHFPGGWRQMLTDLKNDSDKLRKLFIFLVWDFPYYGSIDAGAWYIILLYRYFQKTYDISLLQQLWPSAIQVCVWLDKHATHTKSGLVGFRRHYIFGLRNQSWKDNLDIKIAPPVAMVEVQGYYYYALKLMAELAKEAMGDIALATQFESRADKLRQSFEKYFLNDEHGLPLAVYGRGSAVNIVTSNPGHLLFTGILTKADEKRVVARLFQDDLLTDYGIRTESSRSSSFKQSSYHQGSIWPFDNWVIYQGLQKNGYLAEAGVLKNAMLKAYKELGRIPELYGVEADTARIFELPSACTVQAWSAGALINMVSEEEAVL